MRQRTLLLIVALTVILALYAESFRLPAILFRLVSISDRGAYSDGHLVRSGTKMAFLGLFGPLKLNFAVFANPLLLAGGTLLVLRRTQTAVRCLGGAVLCALQTFQLLFMPIPEDESGANYSYMVHPLAGWYCWCGALLLAFLLALAVRFEERRSPVAEDA